MLHSEVLTREHVVINGVSCVVGFCLALLGLLVVNGTNVRFDDDANLIGGNKMTILVADEWALAIVVFVYLFVALSNNVSHQEVSSSGANHRSYPSYLHERGLPSKGQRSRIVLRRRRGQETIWRP